VKITGFDFFGRMVLALGLFVGGATACTLMQPSPTSPPRVDDAVTIPVGDETVTISGSGEERPSLVADDVVDTVTTIGGTVSGNPLLWGLLGQLGHLGIGLFRKREN
jgi:hypothetical protein